MPNKISRLLCAALIAATCLLPACARSGAVNTDGSGAGISGAQAAAGVEYLETSIVALQKALDAAKETGDPGKVATAQSVLDQAKATAEVFKATIPASQDQWDVARSVLTTAVSVLGPIALEALVR